MTTHSTSPDLRSSLMVSRELQLRPEEAGDRQIQFVSESGGRQYLILCPELKEIFQEEMQMLALSQTVDKTVSGGITTFWRAVTNPKYVEAVNGALDKISDVVKGEQLGQLDKRVQQLFLARALQWTDEIVVANQLSGIKDFDNRKMEALQDRLIRAGASRQYFQALNFFEGIAKIAFQDGGPRFRYPSFSHQDELKGTDPNGILMRQGGSWLLAPIGHAPDQSAVLSELSQIVESFKTDQVASKMTDEELLHCLALIGQVMTNYLRQIDNAPPVSNQVFIQLNTLHKLISKHLSGRGENGLAIHLNKQGLEDFKDTFGVLSNVLRKAEFADFYSKGDKIALMEEADSILSPFITFHLNPELMAHKHQWTVICSDAKNGVHVFKNPKNELIVIFEGHNSYWEKQKFNAFAFAGGRGTEFELDDGLVHQQSLDEAAKARSALMKIMLARGPEIGDFSKVRFVGYGLDGTIAQLIGLDYKKTHLDKDVMVIGCGVPPFLDQAAAGSMGIAMNHVKGFKCLNYAMAGDSNMRNLGLTGPLGMRYDNSAFVTIPVPQGVIFASESMRGDTRKAYMQMLRMSHQMHFAMRDVYLETERAYEMLEQVQPIVPVSHRIESGEKVEAIEGSFVVVEDDAQ
jgi:hypothetical protein